MRADSKPVRRMMQRYRARGRMPRRLKMDKNGSCCNACIVLTAGSGWQMTSLARADGRDKELKARASKSTCFECVSVWMRGGGWNSVPRPDETARAHPPRASVGIDHKALPAAVKIAFMMIAVARMTSAHGGECHRLQSASQHSMRIYLYTCLAMRIQRAVNVCWFFPSASRRSVIPSSKTEEQGTSRWLFHKNSKNKRNEKKTKPTRATCSSNLQVHSPCTGLVMALEFDAIPSFLPSFLTTVG